jgi:hypothetical protein
VTDDDANETLQLTVEEKRALIRLLKRTIGTSPRSAESDPRQAGTRRNRSDRRNWPDRSQSRPAAP